MRDSSADRAATLERVRPRNVYVLLSIIQSSALRERSFIESRFVESATHFAETAEFLESVGWIRHANGQLLPAGDAAPRVVAADDGQRGRLLAEALFGAAGPYERLFARYLTHFTRRSDGRLVYQPTIDARLRDTGARDFLMDLGAVTHRASEDLYFLEKPFEPWALWARNVTGSSAHQLRLAADEQLALGTRAELAVVEWERARVGSSWQDRVRHVAAENPGACFDIQSITVAEGQPKQRYIEVKAVALGSFEFHWSQPEIEAAEILRDEYFLYLLPVVGSGFDLARMEVIQDAFAQVLRNPSGWSTTAADTVCRKR